MTTEQTPRTKHGQQLVRLIGNIRERAGLPRFDSAYSMAVADVEAEARAEQQAAEGLREALIRIRNESRTTGDAHCRWCLVSEGIDHLDDCPVAIARAALSPSAAETAK